MKLLQLYAIRILMIFTLNFQFRSFYHKCTIEMSDISEYRILQIESFTRVPSEQVSTAIRNSTSLSDVSPHNLKYTSDTSIY